MAHLVVKDLTKIYERGKVRALSRVSFELDKGMFLVLIGLSGSGKSTLLRCINRLVEPTSGQVFLNGVELTRLSASAMREVRSRIGMVFQQFNLVKRATVLQNVLAGRLGYNFTLPTLFGYFPKADLRRAQKCLERVGLLDKMYVRADQLSGGQQQRVGIARALMQEPELLLADEPVSALDPATSHSVMRYIEQINREDGVTVIASLHFLSLARRYGQRIIALKAGEIVFDGLPEAIDNQKFKEIYGEEAEEVEVR
ncbi:MAG: phosphonate ABC transporter ATP-binding protein [Candidatus Bipolaricaulaceae bacterium]